MRRRKRLLPATADTSVKLIAVTAQISASRPIFMKTPSIPYLARKIIRTTYLTWKSAWWWLALRGFTTGNGWFTCQNEHPSSELSRTTILLSVRV